MLAAMALAQSSNVSANRAADLHGVPRSTLKDRLRGRVVHGTKPGPRPYLDTAEESELVDYLFESAKAGYGKTRQQVKGIAEKVANSKGVLKSKHISDGWWRRFLTRQPKLALRRGDTTAHVRMDAINRENIQNYYDLLKDVLDEHNLMDHPVQIYNMDETGVPFDPRPPKVVAPKGLRYRSSGKKGQVTVVACASATGQAIPPYVIFDAKQLNPAWFKGEVPGTRYGLSDSGWIDRELFHLWLSKHFLTHAIGNRPLLLLLDGHSSHYEPETIRFAKENDIIVFCLPPHTTHEAQPLDCSLFRPLKSAWTRSCHEFHQQNPGMVITKFNCSEIFCKAWMKTVTPETICSGFRTAGVYPYNPNAINIPNTDKQQSKPVDHSSAATPGGVATAGGAAQVRPTFTPEQEIVFERRYEENYDLYDTEYVSWLEINHPEAVPNMGHDMDLLSQFLHVTPSEPVLVIDPPVTPSEPSLVTTPSASLPVTPSAPSLVTTPSASLPVTPSEPSLVTTPSASLPVTPSEPSLVTTPSASLPVTPSEPSLVTPPSASLPVTPSAPSLVTTLSASLPVTPSEPSLVTTPSASLPVTPSAPSLVTTPSASLPVTPSEPSLVTTPSASLPVTPSEPSLVTTPSASLPVTPSELSLVTTPSASLPVTPSAPSLVTTPSTSLPVTPSAPSLVTTPSASPSSSVSQFLTPIRPCVTRKTGSARVLTSAECLSMLKEKTVQKRKEAEEKERRKKERRKKERRKKEREDKKRHREEEGKRKAIERQQKQQHREELRKKKAEEKARKAIEKARKVKTNVKAIRKVSTDDTLTETPMQSSGLNEPTEPSA